MSLPFDLPIVVAIGWQEIALVVVIVVLLFGATKIPELARSLGRAKSEFDSGKREGEKEADAERLRREAESLGIDASGKSSDELRRLVAARRQERL